MRGIKLDQIEYVMKPEGGFIEVPMKLYKKRVLELENEGLTTSDAQGVADVEFLKNAEII